MFEDMINLEDMINSVFGYPLGDNQNQQMYQDYMNRLMNCHQFNVPRYVNSGARIIDGECERIDDVKELEFDQKTNL